MVMCIWFDVDNCEVLVIESVLVILSGDEFFMFMDLFSIVGWFLIWYVCVLSVNLDGEVWELD